jgi:glycosyltransferase involved in cell wall biosynthesis
VTSLKIAHISTVHPVFDIRIFHMECKTLAGAGHDVSLVVTNDRDEIADGIRILGLPRVSGRFSRMTLGAVRALKRALKENARIYHLHDPELLPIGILLKLCGKCVVYDAHEDFPRQVLTHHWIPRPMRPPVAAAVGLLIRAAARIFDGVIAATPSIEKSFRKVNTVTVQNFPDPSEFLPSSSSPYQERPPHIAYLGVLAPVRGVHEMTRAMALLPESLRARLVCAGSFSPDELEGEMHQVPGWDRVEFVGWKNREEIARLLSQSRAGIVVLHPTPAYLEAWAIKMFEYMAAGIPVVASDFPLWRSIVEDAGCGLLVDPQQPQAIADAIRWILEHPREAEAMGIRGREAVMRRYNWSLEAQRLLDFYSKMA